MNTSSHINKSCHIYIYIHISIYVYTWRTWMIKWCHMWQRRVTREYVVTYEYVMSYIYIYTCIYICIYMAHMNDQMMSHVGESCNTWTHRHTWICHVLCEKVMAHMNDWVMSHVTESCNIWIRRHTWMCDIWHECVIRHIHMYVSFIGLRLTKTSLTLINRTRLRTKGQSAGYPHVTRLWMRNWVV